MLNEKDVLTSSARIGSRSRFTIPIRLDARSVTPHSSSTPLATAAQGGENLSRPRNEERVECAEVLTAAHRISLSIALNFAASTNSVVTPWSAA